MEAKNLRIGNYFTWIDEYDERNAVLTLVGIYLNDAIWVEWAWEDGSNDNTDCDLETIKGITITEEWCFKFGFTKNDNGNYWIDLQTHNLELIRFGKYLYPLYVQYAEMHHEDNQMVSLNRIEFVHELQNLFFTLAGIDLEIKQ